MVRLHPPRFKRFRRRAGSSCRRLSIRWSEAHESTVPAFPRALGFSGEIPWVDFGLPSGKVENRELIIGTPHLFFVEPMGLSPLNDHYDGFVHLVANYSPGPNLSSFKAHVTLSPTPFERPVSWSAVAARSRLGR